MIVRNRLKPLVRDTAIVIAVSAGLLLVLELLLRLLAPQELAGTSVRGSHFSRLDAALGTRYVPNAVWRFSHPEYSATYAINSDGFRDAKNWSDQKSAGTVRVLLLGDSFTFGQGADYDQIWPVLAERELARQGLKVELVKAGIQGMDTRSELILLRRLIERYRADAVVVGFLINDFYTNIPYSETRPASPGLEEIHGRVFRRRGRFEFHLLTLAHRIVSASDAAYIAFYLRTGNVGNYFKLPLSDGARRQVEITETLLRQMAAYCDSIGKPLVVFSMPQQFQILYPRSGRSDPGIDVAYPDRHFSQLAAATGFEWVPARESFVKAAEISDQDLFYRLDGHFTPAGNAVAAEVFVEKVIPRILAETTLAGRVSAGRPSRRKE
jgi:lysophospholipase L1-like esterase